MAGHETPATRAARQAGIAFEIHEYEHDPSVASYGLEAAQALGLDPARVFKTLLVQRADQPTVCVLPVSATLDLRALGKRTAMLDPQRAESLTGYVTGGISPVGQRRRLPTLLDESAEAHDTIAVSAGRRGLEIELAPADLVALTGADVRRLTRDE
ncbi:YbaK family protein [Patulibacter medicamentivorans]|jgi:Cys-tRNA(Pro)/Cys-tRNA(Cys) deacylase|uniref:Cys-tRNA(Pro)/Cys-tRNA(Cys) deacylase n=1 Tax=Patulibacter medicamentivorans TaxID=1097667 RepID=H0E714_9ACTN|nr:Cys-tRNA(Pro) deacylase [Patulibacter medicamentivorans]EHN10509.1 YbaK family protein [Patulibacter medicamentivorans]